MCQECIMINEQIMELFKVAPFDQNLRYNGEYLTETTKTLAELRVLPGSLIYLKADEVDESALANGKNGLINGNGRGEEEDASWTINHPEEGFKGEI